MLRIFRCIKKCSHSGVGKYVLEMVKVENKSRRENVSYVTFTHYFIFLLIYTFTLLQMKVFKSMLPLLVQRSENGNHMNCELML